MKKDKKFLLELEKNLGNISKQNKEKIIDKYANIIKEEKAKNRKITDILKELGNPSKIAEEELKNVKKPFFIKMRKNNKVVNINKKENSKKNTKYKPNKNKDNKETIITKEEPKVEKKESKVGSRLKFAANLLTKDLTKKSERKEKKNNKEKKVKKIKVKREEPLKDKFNNFVNKLKPKKKDKKEKKESKVVEVVEPKETITEVIEDIHDDIKDEIENVNEIVTEKHIFESKSQRRKRIILKTIGIIFITILLFIWLWLLVVFFASIFAYLDGVKFIGLNIGLAGAVLLLFWIIIIINKAIFKRRNRLVLNLIIIFVSIIVIALGIALMIKQVSEIKTVKDVNIKYNMTNKFNTYEFSSDPDKKYAITFNSNYNTQYIIDYDDTLNNKFKLEVKYYECYYDYYIKETSNNIYVSLKLDNRDRLSVYIDDIKEGLVFDNDELSRYFVKITVNPKDAERLVINN